jgi:hypothetical protein
MKQQFLMTALVTLFSISAHATSILCFDRSADYGRGYMAKVTQDSDRHFLSLSSRDQLVINEQSVHEKKVPVVNGLERTDFIGNGIHLIISPKRVNEGHYAMLSKSAMNSVVLLYCNYFD